MADMNEVDLGGTLVALNISAGYCHTCVVAVAVDDDRDITVHKCFGRNSYGQLGLGDTQHRGTSPSDMGHRLACGIQARI